MSAFHPKRTLLTVGSQVAMLRLFLLAGLLACAFACGGTGDVILEKSPFQQFQDPYANGTRAEVITRARRFAEENGLRIVAKEFGPEGFSILLSTADLNLIAAHSNSGGAPLEIDGIARGAVTEEHRELLLRFRESISRNAAIRP